MDGFDLPVQGVLSFPIVLGPLDVLDGRAFPREMELELLELRTTGTIRVLLALLTLLLDPTLDLLLFSLRPSR